jgi:hypothetical protein
VKPASGTATEHAVLTLLLGQPDGSTKRYDAKLKIRRPG